MLPPSAPERTSNLEEIIPFYQFLLVDSCLINLDSDLSEELYLVKNPAQLPRFTSRLEELKQSIQTLQDYIAKYNHLYVTSEVQEELAPFSAHLRQVQSYNNLKWREQQRELRPGTSRPKFDRWNKRHNKILEQLEEEDFDSSGYESRVGRALDLIREVADNIESLSKSFPVYHYSGNLPRLATKKASIADASLVAALLDYAQKAEHQQHAAAILTADGDIFQLFHKHLQTLSPAEQRDLSSRVAVHFWSHLQPGFIRLGYTPPSSVREAEGHRIFHGKIL